MRTRLCDTSRRNVVIVLVKRVLHLLQELVDVDQIALGADIAHWGKVVWGSRVTTTAVRTTSSHWSGHWLVFGQRSSCQYGQR
jgi:hypothetical protein